MPFRPSMRIPLLGALFLAPPLVAQQPGSAAPAPTQPTRPVTLVPALKPPVADTGIFSPLPLPEPTDTRNPDGSPGPQYWQQTVDYTLKASLDTAAKRLSGTEQVRYTNNSPDTLRFVWMQVDQNLFRPGSVGSLLFAQESRFGGAGFPGGFEIESISQSMAMAKPPATAAGRRRAAAASQASARSTPLKWRVDDTMMYLDLAAPLAPGASTTL